MVYLADVLIFFAFMFVIVDFFAMSFGVFTAAGAVFFIVGTVILFSAVSVVPAFFIKIVLPTYIALTVFVSIFIYLGYKAYRAKVKSGKATFINQIGEVAKDIKSEAEGKIFINGELWTAYSDYEILKDSKAVVISVDGKLRLKVKPVK